MIDRIQPPRDYLPPPPPRDYPPYDYARYSSSRDPRYAGYDYAPPSRDLRRPPSPPPRDYRDYPPPTVSRPGRDVDDFRMRSAPRYDSRSGYYPEPDLPPPGYQQRYSAPPPRDYYDRYDRRPPPAGDRFSPYPAPPPVRARSPAGPPAPLPRSRDEYERPPR